MSKPKQLTADDLEKMTPNEIIAARKAGQLEKFDEFRRRGRRYNPSRAPRVPYPAVNPADVTAPDQLTRDDLDAMAPAEITAAYRAGRLDAVLGRTATNTTKEN